MAEPERLDPEIIRSRIRAAIQELPPESQLEALNAVSKGDVELSLGPSEDEIWVQIGDLTVILDLEECVAPVADGT